MAKVSKSFDWGFLNSLKPSTLVSVMSFRSQNTALLKTISDLQVDPINFSSYSVLKNQSLVQDAKKALDEFKPSAYPLAAQLKVIEDARVAMAKQTETVVLQELESLVALSKDIDQARAVDQLTVEDVAKAFPALDGNIAKMAKRGQWRVPGYYEKFGEFSVGF